MRTKEEPVEGCACRGLRKCSAAWPRAFQRATMSSLMFTLYFSTAFWMPAMLRTRAKMCHSVVAGCCSGRTLKSHLMLSASAAQRT